MWINWKIASTCDYVDDEEAENGVNWKGIGPGGESDQDVHPAGRLPVNRNWLLLNERDPPTAKVIRMFLTFARSLAHQYQKHYQQWLHLHRSDPMLILRKKSYF